MSEFDRASQPVPQTSQFHWNWPVFIASWVLLVLLAPTLFFFHRWQKVQLSDSFLRSAERHKENQEWGKAIVDLELYLDFHEEDAGKRIELAELYDNNASDFFSSFAVLNKVSTAIGLCESDPTFRDKLPTLRRILIVRQLQVGLYEDALQQIAQAAGPEPSAEMERLLALTRYNLAIDQRNDRWDESARSIAPEWIWPLGDMPPVELLMRALNSNPGDPELTGALAYILLDAPKLLANTPFATASEQDLKERLRLWNEEMIAKNSDASTAWLAYFAISDKLDPSKSDANINLILEKFPDDLGVMRTASEYYLKRAATLNSAADKPMHDAMLTRAQTLLEQVLDQGGKAAAANSSLYASLGDIALEKGQPEAAIQTWNDGILKCPAPTSFLHFRKVKTLVQLRALDRALVALRAMDEAIRKETIDEGNRSNANLSIAKVGQQLWTAYYIAQKDYAAVTRLLSELAADTNRTPEARAEILAAVGTSCMNSAQWDRAGTAYEGASLLVPNEPQYRRGAAEAWSNANRLGESLQQSKAIEDKTPEDWYRIAVTVLSMQLQRIPDPDLWIAFDEAVQKARTQIPLATAPPVAAWRLDLLQIEANVAKASDEQRTGTIENSVPAVLALCDAAPQNSELYRRASNLLRNWGRLDEVNRLSEAFRKDNPDSTEAVLERARSLAAQGELDNAKTQLLDQLNRQPLDNVILNALVLIDASPEGRAQTLEKLKPWCGRDVARLARVASLALQLPIVTVAANSGEASRLTRDMERWSQPILDIENRVREIEGPRGSEWRWIQARRILAMASLDPSVDLEPVAAIVRSLEIERPLWASTHTLTGMLAEQQRDPSKAIQAYEKAISIGENNPLVYEKLIAVLLREGMTREAQERIRSIGQRANLSTSIAGALLELAVDKDELMSLAKSGIEKRPNDPMAWVWYAQFLDANSRPLSDQERASQLPAIEAALVKAEQLSNGGEIRVYNAAYDFYTATNQKEKLNAMLQRIRSSTALTPDVQWLFLAIAQQSQGDFELAESYYRVALKSGGDPREIGILLAKLYLNQGKIDASIDQLEPLRKEFPKDTQVRESLAIVLSVRGTLSDWDRLQKLLTDAEDANTHEDRRTLSKLLVRRGTTDDVKHATEILESLVLNPSHRTDEDSSRLASIYVTRASELPDSPAARTQRDRLLKLADDQLKQTIAGNLAKPDYLFTYGIFLLDQQRTNEVSPILKRLSGLAPDSSNTMLLRTRWLAADGRPDVARDGVLEWLATQRQGLAANANTAIEDQLLANAINALYWIDDSAAAAKIMDELTERNASVADLLWLTLCESPKPQVRNEALGAILQRSGNPLSRELAFRLCRFLAIQTYSPELIADAEKRLVQFETEHPEDAEFRIYLADHWISIGNTTAAIASLQEAVALEPENVFALNNLANLLGEQPEGRQQALVHIDTALRIAGQRPDLLDSKATILMNNGDFAAAIPLLQLAATNGIDPRFNLHWYMALKRANRTEEAEQLRPEIDLSALRQTHLSTMDTQELDRLSSSSLSTQN